MLWITLVLLLLLAPAASAQIPPFPSQMTPTVIAGTGEPVEDDDSRGDGGPATAARFNIVDGLDWAGDGSILIADGEDARIRHILPSGNIRTNGSSDGVDDPIAVISTGWYPNEPFVPHSFLVADVGDDTVEDWFLEFSPFTSQWKHTDAMEQIDVTDIEYSLSGFWAADPGGGTVWFVRFIGFPTNAWERTPQLENLDDPRGIGPIPGQGFLVATRGDCQIRRHTDNGTVVLAGTGVCIGPDHTGGGDGGPATAARLRFPNDVEPTPDGGFVFIERERVRRVAPDGMLSTLYLTGLPISPDFPPPEPTALEVTPDGDVLIGLNRQVLRFDTNYAPPANPTPTPTPTPNPQPPPPAGPDTTTPGLALAGKKIQKAGKTVSVVVSATTEDLYASASGTVSVPGASKVYRLKSVANRFVARGTKATLKLKVPKAALKAIKRALRSRKRVKANIKLAARDGAGNVTTARRTVKLKR